MKFCRQSARFTVALAALIAGAVFPCRAADPAWRVAVVGFERPAGVRTAPIPGAQSTELAAQRPGGEYLGQAEFAALGLDWPAFQAKAAPAASALLKKVTPEWIRGRGEVIDAAILRGPRPGDDVTPVILAPDFLKRFTPVFGRKVLIAIPERGTVFLFPRLASRYQDYAARVLAVYRKSKAPVSREVLELGPGGLRAVGVFEE